MRKSNSEFITAFISNEGNQKTNKDYFAYVELEEMGCWVVANSLDSNEEQASAELAVASIINDFSENPSMKKKDLEKYIQNANNTLIYESRMSRLKANVTIVISNYEKLVVVSLGNSRAYILKKGYIDYKSKDHTVSQIMADIGKIDQKKINQHEERDNITQYLGMEGKLKPLITSNQYQLTDGDTLLMCTSGFWENIKDVEIEDILKESNDVQQFLSSLEEIILEKNNENLKNYTMASVFFNKVFKDLTPKKKFTPKLVAGVVLPLIIIVCSFFFYNKTKSIKSAKLAKLAKLAKVNQIKLADLEKMKQLKLKKEKEEAELEAKKIAKENEELELKNLLENLNGQEKEADLLYEQQQYELALENYSEILSSYITLKKESNIKIVDSKINNTKIILQGKTLEKDGDLFLSGKEYLKSKTKFEDAKNNYLLVPNYDTTSLDNKLYEIEITLKGFDLEKEGDIYYKNKNYISASVKYTKAKEEFSKIKNYNVDILDDKIKNSDILNLGNKIEKTGNLEFDKQNYEKARQYYKNAAGIFKDSSFTTQYSEVNSKIKKINLILEAINLEKDAKKLEKLNDLENAKIKYNNAVALYKEVEFVQDEEKLKLKISEIELILLNRKREKEADEKVKEADASLLAKNFEISRTKYKEAKITFQELSLFIKTEEIDQKLENLAFEEEYTKGKEYEEIADNLFENKKYDEAIEDYEKARKIYSDLDKTEDFSLVDEKITKAKKKKRKFIFF